MSRYNGYNNARREAMKRYRATGKVQRIQLDMTGDALEVWQAYADSIGMKRASMIRDCVRRCMELDSWTHPGANRTEPPASEPAQSETAEPGADHVETVKRKRGRLRKVQAVDMVADGMETDAHNNADAVGIVADTIGAYATTPPRRKRGRPRKSEA